MALTDETGGGMVMPVSPMYGSGNGFGGFGDGGWWILLLFILLGGNGWGNGFGGFGGGELYPWMNQSNQISNGFRDQMLNTSISDIQNTLNTNQISDLQQSFASQTAMLQGFNQIGSQFADCCCENRLGTADLKYTIATENCADRAAISDGIRDVIASQTAGVQKILDQLCNDKIEQKNDIIAQLRSELMYARGQASQDVQTAAIQAGQRTLANEIEQYVLPTPRPAYVVANPNCCTTYGGCGCGVG